jgi:hypothetical protein
MSNAEPARMHRAHLIGSFALCHYIETSEVVSMKSARFLISLAQTFILFCNKLKSGRSS